MAAVRKAPWTAFLVLLFTSSTRALVLQHDASKDGMATTTSFLVDFDGPKSPLVIVSAGAVGGTDGMSDAWGRTATTCADVTEGSGITGISYRMSTHDQHTFITMASTNHSNYQESFAAAYMKRGQAVIYTFDPNPSSSRNTFTYRQTYHPSHVVNAEDNLWSIEVNAQSKVEFKLNGVMYYTTTTDVVYPWHVIVDLYRKGDAATALHDISYIGGVPAVTIPSIACGTNWPTPTPASATGDPHLQNVHGERFDLMVPGNHVLINIPRGADNALLRVQADAHRVGEQCADMYFQAVNVTGSWAEAIQAGGYHYSVSQSEAVVPEWVAFGNVDLKVVRGRTDSGVHYFNVYVKHLGRAGFAVGGLLGEDDHLDVSTPPAWCKKVVSLDKIHGHLSSRGSSAAATA